MIQPFLSLARPGVCLRNHRGNLPGPQGELHTRPEDRLKRTLLPEKEGIRCSGGEAIPKDHQCRFQRPAQKAPLQSRAHSPYPERNAPEGIQGNETLGDRPSGRGRYRELEGAYRENSAGKRFGKYQKRTIITLPVRRFSSFTPFPGIFCAETAQLSFRAIRHGGRNYF